MNNYRHCCFLFMPFILTRQPNWRDFFFPFEIKDAWFIYFHHVFIIIDFRQFQVQAAGMEPSQQIDQCTFDYTKEYTQVLTNSITRKILNIYMSPGAHNKYVEKPWPRHFSAFYQHAPRALYNKTINWDAFPTFSQPTHCDPEMNFVEDPWWQIW